MGGHGGGEAEEVKKRKRGREQERSDTKGKKRGRDGWRDRRTEWKEGEGEKLATAERENEEEAEEEEESRWSHIKAWRQRGQRCSLATPLLPPSLHPAQTQTFSSHTGREPVQSSSRLTNSGKGGQTVSGGLFRLLL